jgi:hypothetical protein
MHAGDTSERNWSLEWKTWTMACLLPLPPSPSSNETHNPHGVPCNSGISFAKVALITKESTSWVKHLSDKRYQQQMLKMMALHFDRCTEECQECFGLRYSHFEHAASVLLTVSTEAYAGPVRCPQRKQSRGFRSGEQFGQDTGPCLPVHWPVWAVST